jgi:uncharacterized membrane protein (DUF485 family)
MQDPAVDYAKAAQSESFQALLAAKRRFLVPATLFFLAFYFLLPILTSYTHVLEKPAIGKISWAWIYAFAQFVMTWTLAVVYMRKAAEFDSMAADIKEGRNA